MMKVKFLITVAGEDFTYKKGQEVELEQAEAVRYLNANYAEAVKSVEPEKETTEAVEPEKETTEAVEPEKETTEAVEPEKETTEAVEPEKETVKAVKKRTTRKK